MVADVFGTSPARHARLPTCSARLRLAMQGCRRVWHVYGSPCMVADVFGTSTVRHAWLPTCLARLRFAMHGCRRVWHVSGSPCTVADVFGCRASTQSGKDGQCDTHSDTVTQ
ncbi:unnamed protein product [Heligmosomoides polygyrus]|uniref:Uncharacterized protein n=1 Tax=Heligmosomoides polygyrus TaxID=6339 RepID=A0A183FKX8_HELPZ|nr:unnamed protein product [Heligmosomoides polygyrus]